MSSQSPKSFQAEHIRPKSCYLIKGWAKKKSLLFLLVNFSATYESISWTLTFKTFCENLIINRVAILEMMGNNLEDIR